MHQGAALAVVRSAGLRSLADHTVLVHGVYADELRELAGLPADAPLCSPALSEHNRDLARQLDTTQWLHRPEVRLAGAAAREAHYGDEQRRRRVVQLDAVRSKAIAAYRRWLAAEKNEPELAAARRTARSNAHRKFPRRSGMPDLWRLVLLRRSAWPRLPAAQVLQRWLPR